MLRPGMWEVGSICPSPTATNPTIPCGPCSSLSSLRRGEACPARSATTDKTASLRTRHYGGEVQCQSRKQARERIEVHYADGATYSQSPGNSPVSRRDLSGGEESQETVNTWPDGIAFVVTALLFMVPGAILRRGDPQALGAIAGLVALLVAVITGWWHTRCLKRNSAETPGQPPTKV